MTFETLVKKVTKLTPAEEERIALVERLANQDLPPEDSPPGKSIEWTTGDTYILGLLDGTIVSQLFVVHRIASVGGQKVPLGGIGSVATHPDFQRRGFAAAVMRRAEEFMRDEMQVRFGHLVCSSEREPYYRKLGWQTVPGPLQFDYYGSKRQWTEVIMVLPLAGAPWPPGIIDLCGKPW